jgi:hypothetical protein
MLQIFHNLRNQACMSNWTHMFKHISSSFLFSDEPWCEKLFTIRKSDACTQGTRRACSVSFSFVSPRYARRVIALSRPPWFFLQFLIRRHNSSANYWASGENCRRCPKQTTQLCLRAGELCFLCTHEKRKTLARWVVAESAEICTHTPRAVKSPTTSPAPFLSLLFAYFVGDFGTLCLCTRANKQERRSVLRFATTFDKRDSQNAPGDDDQLISRLIDYTWLGSKRICHAAFASPPAVYK